MFLKALTLRGFKSFADKTRLELERGITVVVGPNGSGKSNVVDGLTWVLGSHSAKSLRGGSMADVIFAGSPNKPALGRAAVEITIDNTDGTLPIAFSEVTVSRQMYANGENRYAINGEDCRLLDVAELLSDTGLGKEHHTIVSQGQLDAVLNARPEERRAFIEEAAGILKHRRRKERALRKIAQMEANAERVTDLVRELKRNLRPMERQAQAASRHAELSADLRRVRVVRAVRELDELTRRLDDADRSGGDSAARLREMEARLAAAKAEEAEVEDALSRLAPQVRAAGEMHFLLANLRERYRGLVERIEERRRGLVDAVEEPVAGRDPGQLRQEATRERGVLAELQDAAGTARAAREQAEDTRRGAEQARRAHEQAAAADARRRAHLREQRLRWEGEIATLRSALAQASGEEGRLASRLAGLDAHAESLAADRAGVEEEIERVDAARVRSGEQLAACARLVAARDEAARQAAARERELERRRASLEARAETLRAASQEATGGASGVLDAADRGELADVLGPIADHLRVSDGAAKAVAAALGPLGDAIVLATPDGARLVLRHVRDTGGPRAVLLPARERPAPPDPEAQALASAAAPLLTSQLAGDPQVLTAIGWALAGTHLVDDLEQAAQLGAAHPGRTFVTPAGEVVGPGGWAGGSADAASTIAARAAAEHTEAELADIVAQLTPARDAAAAADSEVEHARARRDEAAADLQEREARRTSASERLGRLRSELAAADTERGVVVGQQEDLAEEATARRARLEQLEARDPGLGASDEPDGPDLDAERLEDALSDAREAEVQARLDASAVEQRGVEAQRRIAALEREADHVDSQLAERERRRAARLSAIDRCATLGRLAGQALAIAERSVGTAVAERDAREEQRAEQQRHLGAVRATLRGIDDALRGVRDAHHVEELRRAELTHAVDAVRDRVREDLHLDPHALLRAARDGVPFHGPAECSLTTDQADESVDDPPGEPDPAPTPLWASDPLAGGQERSEELVESEERLVRKIGLLGTVNPLALQEFATLSERHAFLTEQLEDIQATRDDLLKVVTAVDARIQEVFGKAFADVAAQFAVIFPRLFPGGDGQLVLTDPDDLLHSGVEVEARPPGKRVKRLSLLSGGERALTALAVLFAIFAARPSPFYVLDEVEAALDDVNLQRFLDVIGDFRASSQLVIITHQKRTMEIADTLYGVTMQGNGVSQVLSQRMTQDPATA